MAETINVPGLGPTKSVYVYAGGALVVGIVGYAWWKNSQNQPTDYVGASEDDFGVSDYDSPLGNSGANSTGNYDSTDPDALTTNAKWTAFAVEKLSTYGWDAGLIATALGKYLARQGLTEAEIDIVRAAIAAAGPPPIGGPYPINNALPVPTPTNPTPETRSYSGGNHVMVWIDDTNNQFPGASLTIEKLKSLNPGIPIWKGNDFGFISPSNPERPGQNVIPVFSAGGIAKIR